MNDNKAVIAISVGPLIIFERHVRKYINNF